MSISAGGRGIQSVDDLIRSSGWPQPPLHKHHRRYGYSPRRSSFLRLWVHRSCTGMCGVPSVHSPGDLATFWQHAARARAEQYLRAVQRASPSSKMLKLLDCLLNELKVVLALSRHLARTSGEDQWKAQASAVHQGALKYETHLYGDKQLYRRLQRLWVELDQEQSPGGRPLKAGQAIANVTYRDMCWRLLVEFESYGALLEDAHDPGSLACLELDPQQQSAARTLRKHEATLIDQIQTAVSSPRCSSIMTLSPMDQVVLGGPVPQGMLRRFQEETIGMFRSSWLKGDEFVHVQYDGASLPALRGPQGADQKDKESLRETKEGPDKPVHISLTGQAMTLLLTHASSRCSRRGLAPEAGH